MSTIRLMTQGLAQKVYMVETEKEIELLDRSSFTYKGKTYNYLDMTVEPQEAPRREEHGQEGIR